MDYLSLKASVEEAVALFKGRRITDSFQLSATEVTAVFGKGRALLLSTDPQIGGIYLQELEDKGSRSATSLTELFRARINGAVLTDIDLPEPGERIVHFSFAPGWPDRKGNPITVILEIMGRHSNLLVLEEERILAAIKTVPHGKSRVRPVVPGERYHSPPSRDALPLEQVDPGDLPEPGDADAGQQLLSTVRGFSPHTAAQALLKVDDGSKHALYSALEQMALESGLGKGYLLRSRGRCWLTPFVPLKQEEDDIIEQFELFSTAALAWRDAPKGEDVVRDSGDDLDKALLARIDHTTSAMKQLVKEKDRCHGFQEKRAMAEALLIYASRIAHGISETTLPDPYGKGEPLTIPLDPKLSSQENANRLFSAARRMERGLTELESRGKELQDELDKLRTAREALKNKNNTEPARKILGDDGVRTRPGGAGKDQGYKGPGKRKVVDGFTILVGKSSTDNDKVTFRAAGPSDLWLHARDYPGSHVVIITGKKQVPDKVLYAAAALAAEGSGAKNDTAPEIMVTERKWVKKLKGGKPGQVTVERFRTIRSRNLESGIRNPKK